MGSCAKPGAGRAGDACASGTITAEADARRDGVKAVTKTACGGGVCEANGVGFPGGMCAARCDALGEGGVCGTIPLLADFNACLAAKRPFATCIATSVRPGGLRACDAKSACRDDYVCAKLPNGKGGCMPPYFLFQLRVDGHLVK